MGSLTVLAFVVRQRGDGRRGGAWEEVDVPAPPPGGVVVRVAAAALAWSDVLQMEGGYAGVAPEPPFVAGHEFAGTVVRTAEGCRFAEGDRVFGFLSSPGAFAEYVAAPVISVRATPPGIDDCRAASLTTSYLTADVAVRTVGGLRAGGTIVVHAAAGGVGRCAVQIAVAVGAEVIVATAGTSERRAVARRLGATATSGYDDFAARVIAETGGRGADVVVESIGGDVFDRSIEVLAPFGRLVTIGASSALGPKRLKLPVLWQRSASVCGVHIGRLLAERSDLLRPSWDRLLTSLASGALACETGLIVAPGDIAVGIDALRSRRVSGRVVVDFTVTAPAGTQAGSWRGSPSL